MRALLAYFLTYMTLLLRYSKKPKKFNAKRAAKVKFGNPGGGDKWNNTCGKYECSFSASEYCSHCNTMYCEHHARSHDHWLSRCRGIPLAVRSIRELVEEREQRAAQEER